MHQILLINGTVFLFFPWKKLTHKKMQKNAMQKVLLKTTENPKLYVNKETQFICDLLLRQGEGEMRCFLKSEVANLNLYLSGA